MDPADFDWEQGLYGKAAPVSATRLLFTGDWAPIRGYAEPLRRNPARVYGSLLDDILAADLRVFNLEAPLCPRDSPVAKDGASFRGGPADVKALLVGNVDVACLANNHIMDHGTAGAADTVDVLRASGIATTGYGANRARSY